MNCYICKKVVKNLGAHLKYSHGISLQKYYDRYFRNYSRDEGFCLNCGKETKFYGLKKKYSIYCSTKYISNSKYTKEKIKLTCLKKYGVEHHWKLEKIQEKRKNTNLMRYGVENPLQSKEIREKIKLNFISTYGVGSLNQLKETQEKRKLTCLKRYGVEHPMFLNEVKEKIKRTCLEKYGVENPIQSEKNTRK